MWTQWNLLPSKFLRKGDEKEHPNREQAAFKVPGVYDNVEHPNFVSVTGEFPSAAAAEAFITSPKLEEAMAKAGFIGKPEVTPPSSSNTAWLFFFLSGG